MLAQQRSGWLALALFFCSGATALIYEVIWSKYLSQLFGSTIYAQTVVLAVFMGGLALGNHLLGARSDLMQRPLRAYGIVEVIIGLYAFFFPAFFSMADSLFVSVGSSVLEQPWLLLALKGSLSVALLIVPTVAMGGTLPLIAAWLQKSSAEAGRRSARFYSVNSLGAVCGSAVAGFFLVRELGLVASLQAAALLNMLVGAVAIGLGGLEELKPATTERETKPDEAAPQVSDATLRRAGMLVALTGAVSMGLEVLAARSLVLLFGSSLQAFAIVLMAFILGIGLGSAVIASPRWKSWRSEPLVVGLLLGAALWVGLLVFRIESWVEVYRYTKAGLAQSTVGYLYHQALTAIFSMVVLGVPAAMLGAVLPLMIRALSGHTATLGARIGRLLTWNTLGAVVGVLFAGFVLMPWVGLRNAYCVLAAVLCAAAAWTAWRNGLGRGLGAAGGVGFSLVLLFVFEGDGWRQVMSSGAFRRHEREPDFGAMAERKKQVKILFFEDAADATVSVETTPSVGGAVDQIGLRINGKMDASSYGDLSTQKLLGHLPLLARPGAKDVFVLGLGAGITGGAVLRHPVERLVVAENCEPVIRAAKFFVPWNNGVLTDRRARVVLEDARTVLKLSPQQYDAIITQPSNPWMAGVGSVFSREYYELAASRLKPGGVMVQWFHVYDMHDGIVGLVLRTFGKSFPHVEIWDTGTGDIVLIGSRSPWASGVTEWAHIFERPVVKEDLASIGIHQPAQFAARLFASQRTAFAIPGEGPTQSDQFPVLEYEAPKALYLGITARDIVRFDERTHQRDLADAARLGALNALSVDQLRQTFGGYWTMNEDLKNLLLWRFRHANLPDASEPLELRGIPSVFRPANASPPPTGRFSAVAEVNQRLAGALVTLDGAREQRVQAATAIETLLRERKPTDDWATARLSALAIRRTWGVVEPARTQSLLKLGLEWSPEDTELNYLARVLGREQPDGAKLSVADER